METRDSAPRRRWLTCMALALLTVGPAEAMGGQAEVPRVRSGGADVTAILDLGYARSATFRSLVDLLERSSVIVYVRFARCTGGVPACLHYLGERSGDRYVRVTINRLVGSETRLCCLLAHELQHALELAGAPLPRNQRDVERLLTEIGRRWAEGFETAGAVAVAHAVERELTTATSGREGAQS